MKLVLFLILIASLLNATPREILIKIAGKNTKFFQYDNQSVMINKKCPELEKGRLCDYLEFLKNLSLQGVESLNGGISAGSAVCTEKLKGIIVMGTTGQNNSQISLCKLNSFYIDVGTITYYSTQK